MGGVFDRIHRPERGLLSFLSSRGVDGAAAIGERADRDERRTGRYGGRTSTMRLQCRSRQVPSSRRDSGGVTAIAARASASFQPRAEIRCGMPSAVVATQATARAAPTRKRSAVSSLPSRSARAAWLKSAAARAVVTSERSVAGCATGASGTRPEIARRAGMTDGGEDPTPALEAGRGRRLVAVGGKQLGTYAVVTPQAARGTGRCARAPPPAGSPCGGNVTGATAGLSVEKPQPHNERARPPR